MYTIYKLNITYNIIISILKLVNMIYITQRTKNITITFRHYTIQISVSVIHTYTAFAYNFLKFQTPCVKMPI